MAIQNVFTKAIVTEQNGYLVVTDFPDRIQIIAGMYYESRPEGEKYKGIRFALSHEVALALTELLNEWKKSHKKRGK